jgi:1-deoxy-D-xylulose-5-phosphate synthase
MQDKILTNIFNPEDLRKLKKSNLPLLAKELREFIIDIIATKEGHLGASLGVIELTIALHYIFDTPKDLIVWDVGHQAYGHKILTERREQFHTNRELNGISGFPNRKESVYDTFGVGHSSTSISAALGMAIASNLKGETEKQHIAVIGDASIASGMAFEALNHAGVSKANILVILNDNAIGIDPSVGALKKYFTGIKQGKAKHQHNIFEALNFEYSGPIDGHDFNSLQTELSRLKKIKGPKFLHVITTKGKGLKQAEKNQVTYHAPGKFDAMTGELKVNPKIIQPPKYQDVFGETILDLALKNEKIIGITPAMPTGSSLKIMMDVLPDRAIDVGIAEQHAVTLAAGMATQGMFVYCNIYSTFLQRAYDQIIHDVAIQNLPVIFCIDRAGLVGKDGATHHGVFDIAYLKCIPNLIIFSPRNEIELRNILFTAQLGLKAPIAIRYPRGRGVTIEWKKPYQKIKIGDAKCLKEGRRIAILSNGHIGNSIKQVYDYLNKNEINDLGHYDFPFIKPLNQKLLHNIFKKYEIILTLEDGVKIGGFGSGITEFAIQNAYKNNISILGIPDEFIEHGTTIELYNSIGIDPPNIARIIKEYL